MDKINWDKIQYFRPKEFSENPLYAEPELIYKLDTVRIALNERVYPSPVKGALARFSGSPKSQHYAISRKRSKAIDIFCEGMPVINFLTILSLKLFNGIGIYLDTTGPNGLPWIMFHLDIRTEGFSNNIPWIWFARKKVQDSSVRTKYYYPQIAPEHWEFFRSISLYDKCKMR